MIKNTELRIGNWVECYNHRFRIGALYSEAAQDETFEGEYAYDNIIPIPLSPEILEKLGFSHEGKPSVINGQDFYQVYRYGIFTFNSNHGWWVNNWNLPVQPKYLHELQNLYWCLCGEELEVKGI